MKVSPTRGAPQNGHEGAATEEEPRKLHHTPRSREESPKPHQGAKELAQKGRKAKKRRVTQENVGEG